MIIFFSILCIGLYVTFLYLSLFDIKKTIALSTIFCTAAVILKLSFTRVGIFWIWAWVASLFLGMVSVPVIRFVRNRSFIHSEIGLNLALMCGYGLGMVLVTVATGGNFFYGISRLGYFYLFPLIVIPVFELAGREPSETEFFIKVIFCVSLFSVFFYAAELVYINIFHGDVFCLPWIGNHYSPESHYSYFGKLSLAGLEWQRGFGFLCQPHFSGHIAAIAAICSLCANVYRRKTDLLNNWAVFIFIMLVIIFSFVKTIWIGLALLLLMVPLSSRRRPLYVYFIFVLPLVLLIVMSSPGMTSIARSIFLGRAAYYPLFFDTFRDYLARTDWLALLSGHGFSYQVETFRSDVFIVLVLSRIGIAGMALFIYFSGAPLFYSYHYILEKGDYLYIIRSCQAIIVFGLLSLCHYPTLMNYGIQMMFYISLGILYGLKRQDRIIARKEYQPLPGGPVPPSGWSYGEEGR